MSITTIYCPRPIRRQHAYAPRDHARRDRAVELFESGQYPAAVDETLAYLLPGVALGDISREPLCLVQGTARVRVHIDNGAIVISTVLAALTPDSNATAALRYFLTRLSATGQLFQPRLRDDVVTLEFTDHLTLLHPLKLLEILQRLSTEASNHDTWLVDGFGVESSDRETIAPLEAGDFDRAHEMWDTHWAAADEMITESRRRRSVPLLNSIGSYAVNQPEYTLPLHGSLRAQLSEAADVFTDRDENPNKREAALAKCIKDMRQTSREDLARCLGHARYAISPQQDGTPSLLSSVLGGAQRQQTIGDLNASGRTLESSMHQLTDYLYLLAHFAWSTPIAAALREALDAISGKPLRETAETLWSHSNATLRTYGGSDDESRDDGAEGQAPTAYNA